MEARIACGSSRQAQRSANRPAEWSYCDHKAGSFGEQREEKLGI